MAWIKPNRGRCSLCGEMRSVRYHAAVGEEIYHSCYRRELQPPRPCLQCGLLAPAAMRVTAATWVCRNCYRDRVNTALPVVKSL